MREEMEQDLHQNGFEKEKDIINGSIFTYYKGDAVSVLERQLLVMNNEDMYKEYDSIYTEANLIHALIGLEGAPVIKRIIEENRPDSIWCGKCREMGKHLFPHTCSSAMTIVLSLKRL